MWLIWRIMKLSELISNYLYAREVYSREVADKEAEKIDAFIENLEGQIREVRLEAGDAKRTADYAYDKAFGIERDY